MDDAVAAGDSLPPPRIIFKIGEKKRQPVSRVLTARLEHGVHVALAIQVSHRRTHPMTGA